ncbi:MAG: (Fe-S)-binding protein [bacterium]
MNCETITPTASAKKGEEVHLMLTCLCDAFYPEVGLSAVECLEAAGYRVAFEENQTCCGQPAFNSGDRRSALRGARQTIRTFRRARVVVTPSGSCAAMVRWGFPQLFEGEADLEEARDLARRTWELTEFLTQVAGCPPWPGRYAKRIALHRSCHLRELTVGDAPERLLKAVEGVELVPLRAPEQCCGFGGTFSVGFPWTSREIGAAKLASLRDSGAQEVVSNDMGCLVHLKGLHKREVREGKVAQALSFRHIAEVLREALGQGAGGHAK